MKKIADFIKSNAKQILEVAALFAVIILPWIVNLQELFKVYIESNCPNCGALMDGLEKPLE